jgi:5'-nucleotidase
VQAYSAGRAFARVDFTVDRRAGRVVAVRIFPPRPLCDGGGQLSQMSKVGSFAADACHPEPYEGAPVRFDPAIVEVMAGDVARAAALRAQPLGVVVAAPIRRAEKVPSALGNLAADLMRAAKPGADVAFINGGSLRSDLPPGPLQYGSLYEAFPFDDRLATLRMSARQLAGVVIRNLSRGMGILSLSGVRAVARCQQGRLAVTLYRDDGREIPPEAPLTVVTNGYLASGGDGLLDGIDRDDADDTADEVHARPFRDDIAALLASRGGRLQPSAGPPRLEYPGVRPVQCPPTRAVSPSP